MAPGNRGVGGKGKKKGSGLKKSLKDANDSVTRGVSKIRNRGKARKDYSGNWEADLCDCCVAPDGTEGTGCEVCLCSWFLPMWSIYKTQASVEERYMTTCEHWKAIGLALCCSVGVPIHLCVACCIRGDQVDKYGIQEGSCATCCKMLWCSPCAIAQMSSHELMVGGGDIGIGSTAAGAAVSGASGSDDNTVASSAAGSSD
eukprot:Amastigsp_a677098_205.p1 type:complete len:201 gc:universal Amastigsp_a677098_205:35-637(+)